MATKQPIESTDVPGVREVSFTIREALTNGLAPSENTPRNSQYATTMQNLQAMAALAATPDEITQPSGITNGVAVTDWAAETGVPIIVKGERGRWMLGSTRVYSADSAWSLTAQGATFAAGGVWQHVFFLEIPFFTNGTVFLWGTSASRTTDITVNAVGKDENRLLLGGLAGNVFAGSLFLRVLQLWKDTLKGDALAYTALAWSTGWILYGERKGGSSDRPFDALLAMLGLYTSDNQTDLESHVLTELGAYNWGLCPIRYTGAVLAFHELTSGPVAFGEGGVCRLVRSGSIYEDRRLHNIGIGGRGCAGGHIGECLFLDAAKELWKVGPESAPRKMGGEDGGFSNHLSVLTLAQTIVSYDSGDSLYRIADKTYCFILDSREKLSGPFTVYSQHPVRDGSSLYGLVNDQDEIVAPAIFASSVGWTLDTGWSIAASQLSGSAAATNASKSVTVAIGTAYRVRYAVTVVSGIVRVNLGTTQGTLRAATGVYEEVITPAGSSTLTVEAVTAFTGAITQLSIVPAHLDVLFRSWPIDNDNRNHKHLTAMQLGTENIVERQAGADYRYDDDDASYAVGPYCDATPAGLVFPYPRVEYADAKFVVQGKVLRGNRGRLERVKVQYQADDITGTRGI